MADAGDPGTSRGTSIYGTRAYLAPERLAGVRATAASDVYSLGVVMYELVTGTISGEGADLIDFAELPPSAPMATIIRACLAREPGQRPANAAEVLNALDGLAQAPSVRIATDGAPPRREATRRTVWWWALGPVIAGGLTVSLLIRSGEPTARPVASPLPPAPQPAILPPAPSAPPAAATAAILTAPAPKRLGRKPARTRLPKSDDAAGRQLLASAEQNLKSGSIAEACRLGRQAVERASESPAAWEFLGRCLMRLGQPREARLCYRRFLALSPDDPKALFLEAIVDEDQP
jgi:serine/threonine-protein kinase